MVEVLLDGDEIARRMDCTRRHLERLNAEGEGPPSVKLGRLRRYPESLFDEWIKKLIEGANAVAE
jgi:excisionase family DNA binding protein